MKEVIAILALRVDDVLIAWNEEQFPQECQEIQKKTQERIEWGQWRTESAR